VRHRGIADLRSFVWPVELLDHTATTVPAHPFSVPGSNVKHVALPANGGSDTTGTGSSGSPYATVSKAYDNITTGGTIVMHAGTYTGAAAQLKGGANLSSKFFTLMSNPGDQVWFDGGNSLTSFTTLSSAGAGTYHIWGVGFKRYVTSDNTSSGTNVLYFSGSNGAIFDMYAMVVSLNSGVGMTLYKCAPGSVMDRCIVADNGSLGVNGVGRITYGTHGVDPVDNGTDGWVIKNSYFARNNNTGIGNTFDSAWKDLMANVKIHKTLGIKIFGCIFEDCGNTLAHSDSSGVGLWLDNANKEGVVACCLARGNAYAGIMFEVCTTMTMISCVAYDNSLGWGNRSNILCASPHSNIWHCTSVGGAIPFEIYDDNRSINSDGYAPDTEDIGFAGNLGVGPIGSGSSLFWNYNIIPINSGGTGTDPTDFYTTGGYGKNAWFKNGTSNILRWTVGGADDFSSTTALMNSKHGIGASDVTVTTDPFVKIGTANGQRDLRVKPGSQVYMNAAALTSDMADALVGILDLPAGSIHSYGAISCPQPSWESSF
jgi:hypothetical protein